MRVALPVMLIMLCVSFSSARAVQQLDPYTVQETLSRFPFAQVVPLSGEGGWGVIYANTIGNIHVLRHTDKGWKLEWKLTNLGAKIANFMIDDVEGNGVLELIVATVDGHEYVVVRKYGEDLLLAQFDRVSATAGARFRVAPATDVGTLVLEQIGKLNHEPAIEAVPTVPPAASATDRATTGPGTASPTPK